MISTADIEGKSLALVVVDMQNKFGHGELEAPARSIVAPIDEAISLFRDRGRPVVFVLMDGEGHGVDGIEDPDGFIDGLDVREGDAVIHKTEMNAFCRTPLAGMLHGMGVDGVVVCGLVARWCVHATYFGAYDNDICPYLLKGGTASSDPENTRMVEALCKTVGIPELLRNRGLSQL